ncbi:MAG: chromate transporter [Deltaproteobacteria bacterium]|nr:chromate transporter [Deltaproteobacteria bacterium]
MREVSLARLFKAFAWIGMTGLGGGRIAYLYDDFVERRRWLTREEFLPGFALSQLLPGPTLANLAVLLGNGLKGSWGAGIGFSWACSCPGSWRSCSSAPPTSHTG